MLDILSAALTGTVLFSTTILDWLATSAIILAADSTYFRSAALPYTQLMDNSSLATSTVFFPQNVCYRCDTKIAKKSDQAALR